MILSMILLNLIAILTALYAWMKHEFSYWKRKNVAYLKPLPLIGNLKELLLKKKSVAEQFVDFYNNESVKDHTAFGLYFLNRPVLMVRDPELAKLILTKECHSFAHRHSLADSRRDPLAFHNLFFLRNSDWKEMRWKVTPIFTGVKVKQMFTLTDEIGNDLDKHLCRLTENGISKIQELKELSFLFATDVIASVAFGIRANCLKDKNSEFRKNGKAIFARNPYKFFEYIIVFFLPQFVKLFRPTLFCNEASNFLRSSISFVMTERTKTGIPRGDLIDVLIQIKQSYETQGQIVEMDKLVAQAAIFFVAGFETTALTISFGLYELSMKPDLQKRLREEIKTSLHENDGKLTYESLNEMKYLDMVLNEILRMYPPLPFIDRECTVMSAKGENEFSLKPHIDFSVPNGMPVYIPVFAIQRDPEHFPNPDEFDPERFSPENKHNIKSFTYFPFGAGRRHCLGERLGILQAKLGIVSFLKNHYLEPHEKSHKVMQLEPTGVMLSAKGGIYVNIVKDPLFVKI